MEKDPAFLMYSEKWLQGTSGLMPEEKGVFIDLLCHQHQDGSLPVDLKRLARKAGLSVADFTPIWEGIKHKFVTIQQPSPQGNGQPPLNRLVNQKLVMVVKDRGTKSKRNRITGTLASLIRLSNEKHGVTEKIKIDFDLQHFMEIPEDRLMERLREWFNERLKAHKRTP